MQDGLLCNWACQVVCISCFLEKLLLYRYRFSTIRFSLDFIVSPMRIHMLGPWNLLVLSVFIPLKKALNASLILWGPLLDILNLIGRVLLCSPHFSPCATLPDEKTQSAKVTVVNKAQWLITCHLSASSSLTHFDTHTMSCHCYNYMQGSTVKSQYIYAQCKLRLMLRSVCLNQLPLSANWHCMVQLPYSCTRPQQLHGLWLKDVGPYPKEQWSGKSMDCTLSLKIASIGRLTSSSPIGMILQMLQKLISWSLNWWLVSVWSLPPRIQLYTCSR